MIDTFVSPWGNTSQFDERDTSRSDRRTFVMILVTIASVLAILAWLRFGASRTTVGSDLCLKSGSLAAHSILVIDKTLQVTADQKAFLHQALHRIAADLAPYERLSVYSIDGTTSGTPIPLFSKCSPGTAATVSALTSSPNKAQAEFEQQLLAPVDTLIDRISVKRVASMRPIIETLRTLVTLKDFRPDVPHRRIEIFSDMLQQSRELDQLRRATHTDIGSSLISNPAVKMALEGVQIQVDYVPNPRESRLQTEQHRAFWSELFANSGAKADVVIAPSYASPAITPAKSTPKRATSAALTITGPATAQTTSLRPTIEGTASVPNPGKIWVLVQPVGQAAWVQGEAVVSGRTWSSDDVNVGQKELGVGEDFLIAAVLNPKIQLQRGMRLPSIQSTHAEAISNVVRVTRK